MGGGGWCRGEGGKEEGEEFFFYEVLRNYVSIDTKDEVTATQLN